MPPESAIASGYTAAGVIWIGHYFQWGVELQIPLNHRTGNSVGSMSGFDFYLDDLAPHGFGAPLFRCSEVMSCMHTVPSSPSPPRSRSGCP